MQFFKGTIVCKQFFSDVTVSKQFFSWKFFGMSTWHIFVVEGMTVGHYHRQLEVWRKHSVTLENCFLF